MKKKTSQEALQSNEIEQIPAVSGLRIKIKTIEDEMSRLSALNQKFAAGEQERQVGTMSDSAGPDTAEADRGKKNLEYFRILNNKLQVLLGIGRFYDQLADNTERITAIKKGFKSFLKGFADVSEEKRKEIVASLDDCKDITERDRFIESLYNIIEPYLEVDRADDVNRGFIGPNGLTADIHNHRVELHFTPSQIGSRQLLRKIESEDLALLAQLIKDKPQIKEIRAYSWLVFRLKNTFEKWGFNVSDKVWQDNAGREATEMSISRDDFLYRYGQTK